MEWIISFAAASIVVAVAIIVWGFIIVAATFALRELWCCHGFGVWVSRRVEKWKRK